MSMQDEEWMFMQDYTANNRDSCVNQAWVGRML